MTEAGGGDATLALRVTRAEPIAEGIHLFELRHPDGAPLPPFEAGAHLAVRLPNGAMRTYSLCNDPAERDRYVMAVKRDPAGRGGSVALVDGVRAGATLEVAPPRNLFPLAPGAAEHILVAGGIGITPILSMIHALRRRPDARWRLVYLTRSPAHTAFLDELAAPDLAPHVTLHHDGGDPGQAFDLWPVFEEPTRAHIHCCGPRPLMDAVRDMTGHWPAEQVHFEDFGSDLARPRPEDRAFTVVLARDGAVIGVPAGTTVLDALRAAGRRAPSSCESGTCGTCRTRVLEGEVDHRDLVLTPAERAREMMICVSRAAGDRLVLDA